MSAAVKTQDGRDAHGIRVGAWETGLCGCFTHCVPNCLMVWCLPCVSLAQISSRLGLFKYSTVLLVSLLAYALLIACSGLSAMLLGDVFETAIAEDPTASSVTLGPQATAKAEASSGLLLAMEAVTSVAAVLYLVVLFQLRAKVRERFQLPGNCCADLCVSLCCSFCSIAQLATHVKSYKPGACDFGPPDTLPAYQ